MQAQELAGEALGQRLEARERGRNTLAGLGRIAGEAPGVARAGVWPRVALGGDMLEAEAVPGDLGGRAERDRQCRKRAVGQLERGGHAVLDLDRIDAGGHAAEHARNWPGDIAECVMRMDGWSQQRGA